MLPNARAIDRFIAQHGALLLPLPTWVTGEAKGRRERDSNPRSLRTTVFKTVAIDHSAIPPGSTSRRVA